MDGPHLRWTMDGPHSSYSCLVIHICWKVDREERMEPPIHTEYFLSGGAMILILMMEWKVVSWMPQASIPRKEGWKRASGHLNRSLPMVITWPSGSSYDFSREVEAAAVDISCSKSRAT